MIIKSLLDNDTYKFTMWQAALHRFPDAMVRYKFHCRTPGLDLGKFAVRVVDEINHLCSLRFLGDELEYLSKLRFIKPDFAQFLKLYQYDPQFVKVNSHKSFENNDLEIEVEGPWVHTIGFEVPILAIVSEIYSESQNPDWDLGRNKLDEKIELVKRHGFPQTLTTTELIFLFSEFGGRRRASFDWHDYVIRLLSVTLPENLVGTSNVYFAKKYNLKAIGTQAHEWFQAHQQLGYRLIDFQRMALENWAKEYRGDLGIALSDTVGVNAFLRDFDMYFAKLYDGSRQDSGSPYSYCEKMIHHYEGFKISPLSKFVVPSNGLTMREALKIYHEFRHHINISCGIGTHLTNDLNYKPAQLVMKMVECNGQPVAKISDDPAKGMCEDPEYVEHLKKAFSL